MSNPGPNPTLNPNPNPVPNSDRLKELKEFDESKIGVKGLVDKGLTTIPSFFIHPEEPNPEPKTRPGYKHSVPVVDFSAPRATLVEQIHRASTTLGFFQIINHSVPVDAINGIVGSIKSFNEQPDEVKMKYYSRDMSRGAAYSTNFDLYNSKAATWRDTLQMRLAPTPPEWEYVPEVCREAAVEWDKEVVKIGEELMGLLCEGLGVKKERLKELSCLDARIMAAHYYPYCLEPELTKGLMPHTDPGVLTVLVQNEVTGLQVKYGEDWVDLEPIPGAIVINIGDILQIHTKKRNRLELKRLNDLVFVKYNRTLMRRYKAHNTIDPILLDNIDDANEWLTGVPQNHEDEEVYEGEDLTYGHVAMASGVEENIYGFRGSTLRSKERVATSSSRTLVDEASDDEEDDDQYINDVLTLQEFGVLVEE